ncbi:MAG: hypothetical protein HYX34_01120 [Actinobacteria bacterium]|nr:hypothetical protein [Actinomycetota bacterium]
MLLLLSFALAVAGAVLVALGLLAGSVGALYAAIALGAAALVVVGVSARVDQEEPEPLSGDGPRPLTADDSAADVGPAATMRGSGDDEAITSEPPEERTPHADPAASQ